jgi:hypothetical protein
MAKKNTCIFIGLGSIGLAFIIVVVVLWATGTFSKTGGDILKSGTCSKMGCSKQGTTFSYDSAEQCFYNT